MHVSTFSIVAHDPVTGELGVGVASRFLAVGAVVPWAEAGAGAVATQVAVENFEERWREDDLVDREILTFMRRRYGG